MNSASTPAHDGETLDKKIGVPFRECLGLIIKLYLSAEKVNIVGTRLPPISDFGIIGL